MYTISGDQAGLFNGGPPLLVRRGAPYSAFSIQANSSAAAIESNRAYSPKPLLSRTTFSVQIGILVLQSKQNLHLCKERMPDGSACPENEASRNDQLNFRTPRLKLPL